MASRTLPYVAAALVGVSLAWFLVAKVVFPVDAESATPEVPNVVGESFEDASRKLQGAGFSVERGETRDVKGARPGAVVEQAPTAGTRYKAGSQVRLHTSSSGT